ncbi:MAG: hypothetical protein R6U86_09095 [Bacteroidales bacterium]
MNHTDILMVLAITNYRGEDPEVGITGLSPGMDWLNKFRATRTYALGVNVSL